MEGKIRLAVFGQKRLSREGGMDKNQGYAILKAVMLENIGKEDFFRRFGNPAVIRTQAGEGYIVLSAELYDRMAELCGFPGTKEMIEREPRT